MTGLSATTSVRKSRLAIILGAGLTMMCCQSVLAQSAQPATPGATSQFQPGITAGYIPRDKLIDSLALVPPPPAPGSAAQSADDDARREAIPLRGTTRWKLATRDSDYKSPHAVDVFACTIGVTISPETTPHLYTLLRRTLIDAGLATYKAKIHYNRTRPFVAANDDTICSPQEADMLRKDGSYPSGHSAFGWAWALILAEMFPDRADAIIQRGYQFGQNRIQCGVHWQSDVNAGRVVGAAAVAQLHSNSEFTAEFKEAQKEVLALREAAKSAPDCSLEQQAAKP